MFRRAPESWLMVLAAALVAAIATAANPPTSPTKAALDYLAIPEHFDALIGSGRQDDEIKQFLIERYQAVVAPALLAEIRRWIDSTTLASEDVEEAMAAIRPAAEPRVLFVRRVADDVREVGIRIVTDSEFSESYNIGSLDELINELRIANLNGDQLKRQLATHPERGNVRLRIFSIKTIRFHVVRIGNEWRVATVASTTETSTADIVPECMTGDCASRE